MQSSQFGSRSCSYQSDHILVAIPLSQNPMSTPHQDSLTVMNFNTYLLEVSVGIRFAEKPNMSERSEGIAEWFNTLSPEEMPDVLVLNEIYSYAAEEMLQAITCTKWSRNLPSNFIACGPDSLFEAVTAVVNSTGFFNPIKEGGVVILVKRGIKMLSAVDQVFSAKQGSDQLSKKGFWTVKLQKGTQIYWVLGTHCQAWSGESNVLIRLEQFRQMRQYVDKEISDGARVCFAGDMNTDSLIEAAGMMDALGAPGAPSMQGTLLLRGFWMPLDEDLEVSGDTERNHFMFPDKEEGSKLLDWVIAPGSGDRLAVPTNMRFQIVPLKANAYFASAVPELKGMPTDDLSDHYAVFAQLWYGSGPYGSGPCPDIPQVKGHRGVSGRLPCDLPADIFTSTSESELEGHAACEKCPIS